MSSHNRKGHSPDQIIAKPREAETMLAGGKSIAQVCQHLAVSEVTYNRWKSPSVTPVTFGLLKLPPFSPVVAIAALPPVEVADIFAHGGFTHPQERVRMPVLKSSLAAASLAAAFALAGPAGAAVLFSDNFDDVANGASLAGRTPGTSFNGATWVGPAGNLTGDGAGGIFGNATGGGATAAIDLTAGHLTAHPGIYEISVDITLPAGASTAASWLGMGFAQGTSSSFTSINTATNLVDNNGAPWLLHRRNGAEIVFAGPANTNQALSLTSGSVSTGVSHNFRLVLDTSVPQWTVNGFLDGVQQDLNGAAAGNTYTYASNPVNTHFVAIGTGFNTTSATGTFDNFLVTGVVPEPGSAGLALIGAAVFAMRRRSRR